MASKFEILLQATLDKTASDAQLRKDIEALEKKLSINIGIKADGKQATELKNAINGISNASKEAKTHTQGLGDIVSKFTSWQIVGDIIHGVKDAMSDMVNQVVELDSSLVEFNKVTDLSSSQLSEFTDQAFEAGEQLARTGKEAIDAATEFSKAGYKDQALDLAKTALLYQNIADGEVSTADASALLVSQMKAFKVEAKDSVKIIDQINEVDIRASRYSNVA